MNERHTELADSVADMMPGVYSIQYESGKKGIEFTEEAFEKFAELIVQECAGVCEWQYSHKHKDNTEGAFAAIACSDAILEHFGVEE